MSLTRLLRYTDSGELALGAAGHLIAHLTALQEHQDKVQLALAGGHTAQDVYKAFANIAPTADLDPAKLELWWSSERFVQATDPNRNATQALGVLARTFSLVSGQTHPMPTNSGSADPGEAAFAYATELGDTIFDVCLLGMGADGHVASIFPQHLGQAGHEGATSLAMGVSDAPIAPAERVSLTFQAINRSKQVWVLVSGAEKRDALTSVFSGDQSLPAARVHGEEKTLWFVDLASAEGLPYYHCEL